MSDLFNVPDSTIKLDLRSAPSITFGEYDEIGGKFKTEIVLDGHSVVYVNRVEELCCGAVGSAGKVCAKETAECGTTNHHSKGLRSDIEPGLYIRAGASDFYLSPCLPRGYLSLALLEEFLGHAFVDNLEVAKYFDFAKRLGDDKGTAILSFLELEEFNLELEEAVNAKTPVKKSRTTTSDITFKEVYQGVKSNYADTLLEAGNHEVFTAVKELFDFAISGQDASKTESYNLAQNLNAVIQQLGMWLSTAVAKPPPNVWGETSYG